MLVGYLPFDDDRSIPVMCKKMSMRDYKFPEWISKPAWQVIHDLLNLNPIKRMNLESLYEIAWFKESMKPKIERNVLRSSEVGLNGFDIILKSQGLDLRALFERGLDKRFRSEAKKEVVVEKVKGIGVGLGFKIKEGRRGSTGLEKGKVGAIVEVFEIVKDLLLVVSVKVLRRFTGRLESWT